MFITEELREKVNRALTVMEERVAWLNEVKDLPDADWDKPEIRWAAERALHVAVECCVDVGNDMIDALVMRDPGSYADILRVLMEEDVVTKDWFAAFEGAIQFREQLVRSYTTMEQGQVVQAARVYTPLFPQYADWIRTYLGITQ